MRYVLDSCVALNWVLNEVDSRSAERLRDGFREGRHALIAPDIFPIEVANILTRAERQRRIHQGQASPFLGFLMRNAPQFFPSLPLLPRALSLSSQFRIGVYDCLYVALAEAENCELLTTDEKLRGALPDAPIRLLSSLPE